MLKLLKVLKFTYFNILYTSRYDQITCLIKVILKFEATLSFWLELLLNMFKILLSLHRQYIFVVKLSKAIVKIDQFRYIKIHRWLRGLGK